MTFWLQGSALLLAEKYMLSVLSAFVAEFVTYPLDLTKTRLRIQVGAEKFLIST